MSLLLYLNAIIALLFSATCFIPALDISFFGFILTTAFSVFSLFLSIRFISNPDRKRLGILRKLLEYLPFILFAGFILRRSGHADGFFLLDLVSVLFWICSSGLIMFISFKLSDKRVEKLYPDLEKQKPRNKSIPFQALEWIDALLQAACLVVLLQLFFFQLYIIPSESMVPGFMIKDRVVVVKTTSGPKFPLSNVGIPLIKSYKRGDIVVFSNPHYNDTKEARVRSFASQFVYMLTFTTVNINRDEYGELKADPLVKRVVGVPGEKLMMVDGVLYSKTASSDGFMPVQQDSRWAAWNVAALPRSELALVKQIPLTSDLFMRMESVESIRANVDPILYEAEALALVKKFESLKPSRDTVSVAPDLFPRSRREISSLFLSNDEVTRILLTTNGGSLWFKEFMTAWAVEKNRENLFDTRSMQMNLLLKLNFGKLVVRNAELLSAGVTTEKYQMDGDRAALFSEAESLRFYMNLHDQRNMGEFPKGKNEFIPSHSFMMMGDNRFNSLDMRHSYEVRLANIDDMDPYSFVYRSNLAPQYVQDSKILGTAALRFWPISRFGIPE